MAEFSAAYTDMLKRKLRTHRQNEAIAKKRNQQFLASLQEYQKHHLPPSGSAAPPPVVGRASHVALLKAKQAFADQVELVYPAWQEKLQQMKLQKLRQLEQEKKEIEYRRVVAKQSFEKEQALEMLLQQTTQDITFAATVERNEAYERQLFRQQKLKEAGELEYIIQLRAEEARRRLEGDHLKALGTSPTEQYESLAQKYTPFKLQPGPLPIEVTHAPPTQPSFAPPPRMSHMHDVTDQQNVVAHGQNYFNYPPQPQELPQSSLRHEQQLQQLQQQLQHQQLLLRQQDQWQLQMQNQQQLKEQQRMETQWHVSQQAAVQLIQATNDEYVPVALGIVHGPPQSASATNIQQPPPDAPIIAQSAPDATAPPVNTLRVDESANASLPIEVTAPGTMLYAPVSSALSRDVLQRSPSPTERQKETESRVEESTVAHDSILDDYYQMAQATRASESASGSPLVISPQDLLPTPLPMDDVAPAITLSEGKCSPARNESFPALSIVRAPSATSTTPPMEIEQPVVPSPLKLDDTIHQPSPLPTALSQDMVPQKTSAEATPAAVALEPLPTTEVNKPSIPIPMATAVSDAAPSPVKEEPLPRQQSPTHGTQYTTSHMAPDDAVSLSATLGDTSPAHLSVSLVGLSHDNTTSVKDEVATNSASSHVHMGTAANSNASFPKSSIGSPFKKGVEGSDDAEESKAASLGQSVMSLSIDESFELSQSGSIQGKQSAADVLILDSSHASSSAAYHHGGADILILDDSTTDPPPVDSPEKPIPRMTSAFPQRHTDDDVDDEFNMETPSANVAGKFEEDEEATPDGGTSTATFALTINERMTVLQTLVPRIEETAKEGEHYSSSTPSSIESKSKQDLLKMALGGRKAQIGFFGGDVCFALLIDICKDIGPYLFSDRIFEGKLTEQKLLKDYKSCRERETEYWKLLTSHWKQLLATGGMHGSDAVDLFTGIFVAHLDDEAKAKGTRKLKAFLPAVMGASTSGASSSKSMVQQQPEATSNETKSKQPKQEGNPVDAKLSDAKNVLGLAFMSKDASSPTKKKQDSVLKLAKAGSVTGGLGQRVLRGVNLGEISEFDDDDNIDYAKLVGGPAKTPTSSAGTTPRTSMTGNVSKPTNVKDIMKRAMKDDDFDEDF
ncbi:Aste57867_20076 [Aphanomyces stellatus]|uniref:Aste57867_20076 protein n=1 Tax=Aphanomyces stellatus TaxID=120398 RepID=A0A485LE92_9STRA|nr:hypothetical protein As57867_020010 [Aphanomyces stellatus]VFT96771.1 Aste57867_20076 [Aphanomyces stellatus]